MALLGRFCTAIKMMDQRFSTSLEHEFQQELEPGFVIPVYVGAAMVISTSVWSLFAEGIHVDDPLLLCMALKHISLILLSVFAMSAVFLRRRIARRLCVVNFDFLVVLPCVVGVAILSFGGRWYAAQLFVRDPHQAFGDDVGATETNVVMGLVMVTVATCVAMPIRSHLLWVLPTCGTCMLCAVILLTSSRYPDNLPILLFHICSVSGFSVLAGFRKESHLRKEWLAQRKVKKQIDISEKQRQAFSHLLDRLCDCLVHLGPDLTIMEPCPKLAAMLFLPSRKALRGSRFCDCISTREDKDRFAVAMREGTSETDPAGILPLHFKDSQNQEVQVHMYYTSFNDQDGSPHHIIGIVEAVAQRYVEETTHRHDVPENHTALIGGGCFHSGSASESDSYSCSEGSVALESTSGSDLGEVSVVFKDDDSLNIVSCTTAFTGLCGSIGSDEHLLDWIVDKKEFAGYIQDVQNRFLSIPQFDRRLILVPPVASRARIVYVATFVHLNAVTDSGQADDLSQSRLTLRISLSGIRAKRRRRKPKNRLATSTERPSQRSQLTSL